MAKQLSCGTLIFSDRGELLLCHLTRTAYWDIPKGLNEAQESPLATALRETREECGVELDAAQLHELGRFSYRPDKDLHLFAALQAQLVPAELRCQSVFRDRWGHPLPEADRFAWTPLPQVPTLCAPRMTAVLTQRLDLPAVFASLAATV